MTKKYYVYIYLDPRKPGKYQYSSYIFDYEPFYVGKGCGDRYKKHLIGKNHYNKYFYRKINKIINETNSNPIILIYKNNLIEKEALELEKDLILNIGIGQLTNLTMGGEGVSGWANNKTYEEMYGKEKAYQIKIKRAFDIGERLRNKTYEKIYGEEKAKELKKKQSDFMKNNNPMKNITFSGSKNPNSKDYELINPEGNTFFTSCLKEFAEKHNLNPDYLSMVARGKKESYKGWICKYSYKNSFNGLGFVNIELTSRCQKKCWMCGRRKIDKDYPEIAMNYGDIDFSLLKKIANQIPPGIVVAFHLNGEGLLYPRFGEAIDLFKKQIRVLDTNAKLLTKKSLEIINKLDSITISVIENDPESDEQYAEVVKFLELKGNKKPIVVFRLLGDVSRYDFEYKLQQFPNKKQRWYDLAKKYNCIIATRTLHHPMGSFNYKKRPTIPEIGMCIEAITHLAIDRFGKVSMCVRFDPLKLGVLGDANKESLLDIWNGEKRQKWIELHKKGKRKEIPLCSKCEFWGVPTSS